MKKENLEIVSLMKKLKIQAKEKNAPIWKDMAERLEKPNSLYAEVNVSKIERFANDNEFIIVPGKVLGAGILKKKVKVAALRFSKKAREKIESAGGEVIYIEDAMKRNPKGSNIRIMG